MWARAPVSNRAANRNDAFLSLPADGIAAGRAREVCRSRGSSTRCRSIDACLESPRCSIPHGLYGIQHEVCRNHSLISTGLCRRPPPAASSTAICITSLQIIDYRLLITDCSLQSPVLGLRFADSVSSYLSSRQVLPKGKRTCATRC